jgi:hypothetical protein
MMKIRCVITKGRVIHAYLGCNIIGLMDIAFVIKEMSGKSASVIKSAHCINKQFCAQEVMKLTISEEQFLSLYEQILLETS